MAEQIGVRELKNQASRIVRAVREEMAEYIITVHGEPVALLRPLTPDDTARQRQMHIEAALADLDALAQEIGAIWSDDQLPGTVILDALREE
ncbi:MAG: type II toxin-antitoxin system prevent-host-death family antitoxin [Anaerolineales bacterium]|nr:type II toxin-antitoxin system prevent-host-death family antitoxin [Anaerolineales bacterium]